MQLSEEFYHGHYGISQVTLTITGLQNLKNEYFFLTVFEKMNIKNTCLPIPTIQSMRIVTQVKAVNFPSIIVIDAYTRKYTL